MVTLKEMVMDISNTIMNQMDSILVEALKRKGYEFKMESELLDFIREHGECIYDSSKNPDIKQTYLINGEPFLQVYYPYKIDFSQKVGPGESFTANYCEYSFL